MSSKKPAIILLLVFSLLQLELAGAASQRRETVLSLPVPSDVLASPSIDADPRDETSIAVSPLSDQVIVGVSKVIVGAGAAPPGTIASGNVRTAYYYSSDGGQSWGSSFLPLETNEKAWGRASDPSVAADLNGNFYVCALMLGDFGGDVTFDSGIYIFKSTDGGRTFGVPFPAVVDIGSGSSPKQADKCYITVDTVATSPYKNTIYIIWISTESGTAVVKVSHRRPGEQSFSPPKIISHGGDMRGPSVAVGPNGEFYAAWEGIGSPKVILFNASTDGGDTFLPIDVAPSREIKIHNFVGSLSQPGAAHDVFPISRMNSFPVIDVDRSNGPRRGTIYIVWAESAERGRDADIFIKTLSPPNGHFPDIGPVVRVNNEGSGADQFFPWLSVDPTNGDIGVVFYDRRDDPVGVMMNAYFARSTDGGATFPEDIRISGGSSDPRIQAGVLGSNSSPIGIGDYIGLALLRGKANMLWADSRNGKQEIRFGRLDYNPSGGGGGGGGGTAPANDSCSSPMVIASTPFTDELDTRTATSDAGDPASCSGSLDAKSVWYSITPNANTTYAVDTASSDFDTVVSVYTGACGALTRVACSDDFGDQISPASRSLLAFGAAAGTTYLIEVSAKGSGGTLRLRVGYPAVISVEYTTGPDGSDSLSIVGAGFVNNSATVIVQRDGEDNELPTVFFSGSVQGDGSVTSMFATKKKLKKLVKRNRPVVVRVESPSGSGRGSVSFTFTR